MSEIIILCSAFFGFFWMNANEERPNYSKSEVAPATEAGRTSLQQTSNPLQGVPDDAFATTAYADSAGPAELSSARGAGIDATFVDESQTIAPPKTEIPRLKKYYFLVLQNNASVTLHVNAVDVEKAKAVLRDFRGDPEILRGPVEKLDW